MKFCPQCKTQNDEQNSFCVFCGNVFQTGLPTLVLNDSSAENPVAEQTTEILKSDKQVSTKTTEILSEEIQISTQDNPTQTAPAKTPETVDMGIGKILDNRYRLDSVIKSGGMGKVYRGTRLTLNDPVAIKVLHTENISNNQAIERFRREAQTSALLKHPNTVNIYDFGVTEEGFCYIVMEFVEGASLREILKERGVLSLADTVTIATQIASALEEAHRLGIIHRDLKPDNIIIQQRTDGLKVKILDFGIAKINNMTTADLTQSGYVMGTPRYMSPEQCLGEPLDGRTDIYSMGIMLYEMLTGVTPFNSQTAEAIFAQHISQPPTPLRSHNWNVSPNVEGVVLRALEKRREARQQTAAQFAIELQAAIATDEAETKAAPVAASRPLVTTPKQSIIPRILIALFAMLSLLLVGIVGVLVYPYIRDALTKNSSSLPDHFGIFHARQDSLTELRMREFKNALKARDELQVDSSLPVVESNPTLLFYYEPQMISGTELKLIKLDSINDDGKIEHWDYQVSPFEAKPEIKQIRVKDGLPKGKFALVLFKDYLDEGAHKFWSFEVKDKAENAAEPQILAINLKPKPTPTPTPQPTPEVKKTPPPLPDGPTGVCNENNVVMRASPTQLSAKIGRLDSGNKVAILQYSSNYETWRGITSNFVYVQTTTGKRGWVFRPFITAY